MDTGPRVDFTPNPRLPDPRIEIIDPRFGSLRLFSSTVEQLATGFYWAEGPVWFGDGRYLLFSDIPNNRIMRWDETSGVLSEFRKPSNNANGHGRDRQGRLLSCEHLARRVTRTEYDGKITVLADSYKGKRLNSPNDIVCKSDGSVWFTDPAFGIMGWWEGDLATPELPHGVYRIDPSTGELAMLIEDLDGSNGLAFSPDEKILYVVESLAKPHRKIWQYDAEGNSLKNKRLFVDAGGPGAFDGIAIDTQGNVWCGFGGSSAGGADPALLDGVVVYDPKGVKLGHIHLPERCANLCFGGAKNNRLFMASSHSLYALHVNARGAV
jgi:gluconolactonase